MLVLGIESSCDETGVALIDERARVLAQAVHSQIDLHRDYGGVVPELASRDHARRLIPLIELTLRRAGVERRDLSAIAVTEGPGLAGALLVGASVAHAVGWALGLPVLGVHHLEGHLLSALLDGDPPDFPFIALLVSGAHTQFTRVDAIGSYQTLGETLDDAVGEAFDKTAQLLGESYPGGPAVSALAERGRPGAIELPRPMLHSGDLNMSFSGLKTAVLYATRRQPDPTDRGFRQDLARAFVDAVTEILCAKAERALREQGVRDLVVAGGVSANRQLRAVLTAMAARRGWRARFPELSLCTDNGAMIALAGMTRLRALSEERRSELLETTGFEVRPRWRLG